MACCSRLKSLNQRHPDNGVAARCAYGMSVRIEHSVIADHARRTIPAGGTVTAGADLSGAPIGDNLRSADLCVVVGANFV